MKIVRDSIGFRIMGTFVLVILLVTVGFLIFYSSAMKSYFYENVAAILTAQARTSADLYLTYLSDEDLMTVVTENKDQFYRKNSTQVQILNNSGLLLYDNTASSQVGQLIDSEDVRHAQSNTSWITTFYSKDSQEQVMCLSYPLLSQTGQVGILRLVTSLKEVDRLIHQRELLAASFGLLAVGLMLFLSYFVSSSIAKPIQELTTVANKLADGQMDVRADEDSRGEIGTLARSMNLMADNLAAKDKLKSDFISSVSHELRTPLTAIKGWAITLESGDNPPEITQEGLKIIENESERLGSMVEELLDFSRFSSGRVELKKTSFELVAVTNHIIAQFLPRTREKKIDMVFNYSQPEIFLVADEDRIKQLELNIIDNAIKFTGENGSIIVDLSLDGDKVVISVTDTGIGIAEKDIGLVTEKFWKGTSSASHTGLGLSICEEIARAHGGDMTIKSKLNEGTMVSVELPLERA